ncbi:hypothetical protein [Caulobacter sp. S45]|uniref:hypothetical protein n=1 Tax=Caulobacter sp. S45 TaxID=1641861 RepID=UPI001576C728|nr:hypothetical protein [Caulobacter sp. S45]
MARFIKIALHGTNEIVLINLDAVSLIRPDREWTKVFFAGESGDDASVRVAHSFEAVAKMLEAQDA